MTVKVSYWNKVAKPVAVEGEFVEFYTDGTFTVMGKGAREVIKTVHPNDREDRSVIIE